MRITGGKYKGRKITCPPGIIRPAMDRMRESLFAILRDLDGKSFLDLYSGSGIVGIEAASRGAHPVSLVEKDMRKKRTILQNLAFVTSPIQLFIKSSEGFLKKTSMTFDIVYCDPPFKQPEKGELLQLIHTHNILNPGGITIIHAPQEDSFAPSYGDLQLYDTRKYGRSMLYFYHM